MTSDPKHSDAVTPADTITPHDNLVPESTGKTEPEVNPGIEDPRHSRMGPEILDPPPHSLPPPKNCKN